MKTKFISKSLKAINNEIISFFKKDCLLNMKKFILKNHSSTIKGGRDSDQNIFDKMTSITTNNKKNVDYYYEKLIDNIIISNQDFLINKTTDEINKKYNITTNSPTINTENSPFKYTFSKIFDIILQNIVNLVKPIQEPYLKKNKSKMNYLIQNTLKGGKHQRNTKTKKNKNHIKHPKYFK
jgi:hypothetical protein